MSGMTETVTKIGAVGERDAVLCFKAIGAKVFATQTPDETAKALFTLSQNGVKLIFITETAAKAAAEALAHYQRSADITVIPIPGSRGSNGFGMTRLSANVEKALGADILFGNDKKKEG